DGSSARYRRRQLPKSARQRTAPASSGCRWAWRGAACSSQFLRDTHDRAARTRVGLELFGRGVLRLAEQLEARHESLGDDRQIARQGIRLALGMAAHELLDD